MEEKRTRTNWKEEAIKKILDGKLNNNQLKEIVVGKKEKTTTAKAAPIDLRKQFAIEDAKSLLIKLTDEEFDAAIKDMQEAHKKYKEKCARLTAGKAKKTK